MSLLAGALKAKILVIASPVLVVGLLLFAVIAALGGAAHMGELDKKEEAKSQDEKTVGATEDGYTFPLNPHEVAYSYRNDWGEPRGGGTRTHKGTDIFAELGSPAVAVCSGEVVEIVLAGPVYQPGYAGPCPPAGNSGVMITIRDNQEPYDPSLPEGTLFRYMHMHSIDEHILAEAGVALVAASYSVSAGNMKAVPVTMGQVVGQVGNTGNAWGGPTHIHFGVYPGGGAAVNPFPYLQKWEEAAKSSALGGTASTEIKDGRAVSPSQITAFLKSINSAVLETSPDIGTTIRETCEKFNINPAFVLAISYAEMHCMSRDQYPVGHEPESQTVFNPAGIKGSPTAFQNATAPDGIPLGIVVTGGVDSSGHVKFASWDDGFKALVYTVYPYIYDPNDWRYSYVENDYRQTFEHMSAPYVKGEPFSEFGVWRSWVDRAVPAYEKVLEIARTTQ